MAVDFKNLPDDVLKDGISKGYTLLNAYKGIIDGLDTLFAISKYVDNTNAVLEYESEIKKYTLLYTTAVGIIERGVKEKRRRAEEDEEEG